MDRPRCILIQGCRSCPHSHDYSSGGVDCVHPSIVKDEKGRNIILGYTPRKEIEATTPDWCPLPFSTGIAFA